MNIPSAISKAFESASRVRGAAYYHNCNIVKFVPAGINRVNATVSGEKSYRVQLTVERNTLVVSCTCPHFEEGNNCKHIWAVLLRCSEYDTIPIAKLRAIRNVAAESFGEDFDYDDDVPDWDDFESDDEEPDEPDEAVAKKNDRPWEKLFSIAETTSPEKGPQSGEKIFYHLRFDPFNETQISVSLFKRSREPDGEWSVPKLIPSINGREYFDDENDRIILSLLAGSASYSPYFSGSPRLNVAQATVVVPMMSATGRLFLDLYGSGGAIGPLGFDGTPHTLRARMRETGKGGWELSADIYREDVAVDRSALVAVWRYGLIFTNDRVARFSRSEGVDALHHLLENGPVTISVGSLPEFLDDYYASPVRLPIDLPEEMRPEEVTLTPIPCLRLQSRPVEYGGGFLGTAHFDYEGLEAQMDPELDVLYDQENNRLLRIARSFHHESIDFLDCAGVTFVESRMHSDRVAQIRKKDMLPLVGKLLDAGWRVEGEKGLYKKPGKFSLSVSSGVDWFDLRASCDYEGEYVPLPKILAALKRGEMFVPLGNGAMGMLPEAWLRKYERFVRMGKVDGNTVRFQKTQTLLVDALLDEKDSAVSVDETFSRLREELRTFGGIEPVTPGKSFHGTLRMYQKVGLGWMAFLERFGFGGCLADDMGLGKTVQVLAHLNLRKQRRPKRKKAGEPSTSLVVAPRSLIFNWMAEAKRFAPALRVGDFSGTDRDCVAPVFAEYDLVIITYGTLRRDIMNLKNIKLDYVVLDEAQIIKNASTIAAKSVRLLDGKHRLALSGTPVENRLGDLWSIFEFLNPGMLGATQVFSAIASDPEVDDPAMELLRRALKPFILRRTKSQVATDLPARTEEIVYCEMEGTQKKEYERLKRYYQLNLLGKIEETGINRSKIQILEALLRLRQAACHPGLIDREKNDHPSVKLDTLLAQINELRDEGHKCIVFSQFTKMLAIVKSNLDNACIPFEYLDGKTIDRKSKVDRFQSDPDCGVFLISLKAGGLGLNLTAAEYVFILDPWWNPAAEAQAIDRAHRIGQKKPVFAYKLICKDTVEEKVLELQGRKRRLAESIISNDESIMKSITVEDLKLLLG